jgi:uncharacterized protein YgiM (DUF1202 family)
MDDGVFSSLNPLFSIIRTLGCRRRLRAIFAAVALVSTLLTISACRDKKSGPDTTDLPDLNAQIRLFRVVEDTKVRTGPGEKFRAIGEIRRNSRIQVVGRDGEWLLVVSKTGNVPGYISIDSAQPATGESEENETAGRSVVGMYEAVTNTRVRSGPGLHHPVVAEIKKGTKLNVVSEENGWLRVESKRGNPPGYVEAGLARRLGDASEAKTK